jgi:transposase
VTHPDYIREKALELRRERGLTIDEIAERLALSRSTIYHWVRDIAIPRKPGQSFSQEARKKGNRVMRENFLRKRELCLQRRPAQLPPARRGSHVS